MKKIIFIVFLLFAWAGLNAQIMQPVKWKFYTTHIQGNKHALKFSAKIEPGWHMYSQFIEEGGPIPTSFRFKKGNYTLIESVKEPTPHKEQDPVFAMELAWFNDSVTFTQIVEVKEYPATVQGDLEFMVCNDESCLPPEVPEFELVIKKPKEKQENTETSDPSEEGAEDKPGEDPKKGQGGDTTSTNNTGQSIDILPTQGNKIENPVTWKWEAKSLGSGEFELHFVATIEPGWHLYGLHLEEDGPLPTEFSFLENEFLEFTGEMQEPTPIVKYDPNFDQDLPFFEDSVRFTQRIKAKQYPLDIRGEVSFMSCDEKQCTPPNYLPYGFLVKSEDEIVVLQGEKEEPVDETGDFSFTDLPIDLDSALSDCVDKVLEEQSNLWMLFFLGFLGGLLALFTPCVFPMIPITVGFFLKGSEDRRKGMFRAIMYGIFIFLVYAILSLPFHLLDQVDSGILNDISTNVPLNLFFFVVFIAFAFSFFGYYELTLPSKWSNKMDSASNVGGLLGIFFMALTLAIVSFSCTGPILGSLLAGSLSSEGGAMQLTAGMCGFGLALALPFAMFAAFPSMMKSLPKSGGWLDTFKGVLGFAELALALKFFSNADLVSHWGILKYEIFIGGWIIIGLAMVLFLFGKIRFKKPIPGMPKKKPSFVQTSFAIMVLAFCVYLGTGFLTTEDGQRYKGVALMSGLAPSVCYSIFLPCDCPHELECFKDLQEGLAYAKAHNKPVMLDFTGYACVNCRKMEENVWPEEEIITKLRNEFVVISLYVDDREELPKDQQIQVTLKNGYSKKLRTVGDKWATFEAMKFNANTQPLYALITPDGQLLNNPQGYTPKVKEYEAFLQCGIDAFNNLQKK